MLGAIIGDIVGSTREWHNVKTEDFELLPQGSRFTDDTVMTLAVAKWLMDDPSHKADSLVRIMQDMGRRYPNAGYGGMFRRWLNSDNPQPYGSYGNGSAMRVSPVGMYAKSLDEVLELARITASVTHNHPEGIKGAQAVAAAVYMQLNEEFDVKGEVKRYVEANFGYDLDIKLEDIRNEYQFDASCQGSVPIAIMAFLQRYNAFDTLRLAISMGGDSDTIGCMATSIAYACPFNIISSHTNIPEDVVAKCRELLPKELLDINDRFEAFVTRPLYQSYYLSTRNIFAGEYPGDKYGEKEEERKRRVKDCIRGSLMAGAAGDALGYPVEFMSRNAILARYGDKGITEFKLDSDGKALVSDDTQMTIFTANGMLMGLTRGYMRGIGGDPKDYVDGAYIDWYYTQTVNKKSERDDFHYTWLRDLPELAHRRAPGITCLNACESLLAHRDVENNSKGCGGIMRVAPMGLLDASFKESGGSGFYYKTVYLAEAGAHIARVTHLHPLGYLPAALMTLLLSRIVPLTPDEVKESIIDIINDGLDVMMNMYGNDYAKYKEYLRTLTLKAVNLAYSNISDIQAIMQLGEGWTAEEAWAISLYCVIRHIDNMKEAIIAAVNHDGDSDSTGSITGNIMGAIYGYEAIKRERLFCPYGKKFEDTIELHNIILAIADDLYTGCIISEYDPIDTPEKKQWYARYCEMKPVGI